MSLLIKEKRGRKERARVAKFTALLMIKYPEMNRCYKVINILSPPDYVTKFYANKIVEMHIRNRLNKIENYSPGPMSKCILEIV